MKRFINATAVLLMVSGMLFFVSCDADDEPDAGVPIVGTWSYESADIIIEINGQDILDYLVEVFEMSEEDATAMKESFEETMNEFEGMSWKFESNKTFTATSPEGDETGTWSLNEDHSKLTLVSDDETTVIDVKSLTSSKMELFFAEEFTQDMDEDGEDEVFHLDMTLVLKK